MKVYTIKDNDGNLFPRAILEIENKAKAVRDDAIVEVDYGLEAVNRFLETKDGKGFELAICELKEIV